MKKEINYSGETRFKQAHLNYFATKWKRLDIRGKSSKELKDIINELQKVNRYLLRCVKTLDYKESEAKKLGTVIKNKQKQEDNRAITRAKRYERVIARQNARKLVTEAKSILQSKISDLLSNIRQLRSRIAKGLMRERALRATIRELQKQLEAKPSKDLASQFMVDEVNHWKSKYDEARIRANKTLMRKQRVKTVKTKVIVEVERKRTAEEISALKLKRYLDQPLDKKIANASDIALKSVNFLQSKNLDFVDAQILFKGILFKSFNAKDVGVRNVRLAKMEEKGYISRDKTGLIHLSYYWFLTTKGLELVRDFNKYISNGKNEL